MQNRISEGYSIRKAIDDDMPAVKLLIEETWPEFVPKANSVSLSPLDIALRVEKRFHRGSPMLVATLVDGRIIGVTYAHTFEATPDGENDPHMILADDEWYLLHLVTEPEYRGRGIGISLTLALVEMALLAGKNSIKTTTWSTNAIGIGNYHKAGFEVTDVVEDDRAPGIGTVVLRRNL